jgi:hypothetical protein
MAETELPLRTLELNLVVQGNTFVGSLAPYIPRLLVTVRGSTSRMDLAVPEERRAECRFGAVGVLVGAPPPAATPPGEHVMKWRDLTLAELETLIGFLDAFSDADVDGVPDTGDYFQIVAISGLLDGEPFGLSVSQMQSGWKGANAPQLVDLLRCLFALGGVSLDEPRWHGLNRVRL